MSTFNIEQHDAMQDIKYVLGELISSEVENLLSAGTKYRLTVLNKAREALSLVELEFS